ncbi:hypothetical protein CSC17_4785 [Klebsiella oxytoca]|nr:hypothetical protein CSC17_4785 [Klebsiella oxytoca]EUC87206.1 hypothetical protein HMPREF1570_3541 [Klebsiella oxytoca KA-2]EUC91587.1 hypothetical protein HMPREF1569_4351 [Klebsiella oxytoca OK-1]
MVLPTNLARFMPFSQCVLETALNLLNKGCKFVLKGKIPAIMDKPQRRSAKKQIKC